MKVGQELAEVKFRLDQDSRINSATFISSLRCPQTKHKSQQSGNLITLKSLNYANEHSKTKQNM